MFSKKAKIFDKIFTVDLTLWSKCQINGEDIVNFCGLLRKRELYLVVAHYMVGWIKNQFETCALDKNRFCIVQGYVRRHTLHTQSFSEKRIRFFFQVRENIYLLIKKNIKSGRPLFLTQKLYIQFFSRGTILKLVGTFLYLKMVGTNLQYRKGQ